MARRAQLGGLLGVLLLLTASFLGTVLAADTFLQLCVFAGCAVAVPLHVSWMFSCSALPPTPVMTLTV